ncbi:hypothetical protein [Streptomyces sp. NPDC058572]|uniref:hypothetical protein n=1 Tax=Streptomyces sp. NPDC058572 TaxID=3346546 RepID=UPI003652B46C
MPVSALRRLAPAVLMLLTVPLGGCGGGGGDGATHREPVVTSTPTVLRTQDLRFPLSAYDRSEADQEQLGLAQQMLISRCMARYGFTFRAPSGLGGAPHGQAGARRYGVSDAQTAARYGYAPPPRPRAAGRPPSQPELSESGTLALHGAADLRPEDVPKSQQEAERRTGDVKVNGRAIPIGGCLRESYLKLYAPTPDSVDLLFVFELTAEAETRSREDSRVRAAFGTWAACMKESGFSVSNPAEVPEQLGLDEAELSSPRAVTAAKADVACKQRVNLVGVTYAVESAYQRQLIDEHAETLELVRKQGDERLRLAASLVGE